MFLRFRVILVVLCVSYNNADSDNQCPGLQPIKLPSSSAVGKWHLIYASKLEDKTQEYNTCGFFNTVPPCKCIGLNINSTMTPPKITNYTLHNFGYNEKFNFYANTKIELAHLNNNDDLAIFNAYVPLANVTFTVAIVGSDDYRSWMSIVMCTSLVEEHGSSKLAWLITRSPMPSESVLNEGLKTIKDRANEDINTRVNQNNCPQTL